MSLYRVTWDDQDILDYTDERMVLLSPHLEMEINLAGSLRFVVPPYHTYYDLFTDQTMLISTVRVYEDEELIWFGRPLEMRTDFFKQKEIYCEGGLSYFNDSIHEHNKYDNVSLHDFFRKVVANHNYQVDSPRQFLVGNITVDDKVVYREPRYEKTIDVLRDQCLDTTDGYFFVRQENGKNYIDWLKDMPFSCNQVIEFAENMLDVSTSFDGNDYATCVMPLGANDDNGDPINVYDVNNNDLLIISDMAKLYGRIVTVIQFSDIEDKYELLEEGKKALERIQYNSRIIECSAADLHSKDGSKEIFKLGQLVHCYSEPHNLEIDLPLSKIELNLDTAAKNITLGIIKKKTLTRISRPKETEPYQQEPYTPESYDPGGNIVNSYSDDWEIIMPDENGGPVTAVRMPIKITIARDPNKIIYKPGEKLDFTGLIVNIWTKDKDGKESIWTKPPRYIDGTAPMSELTFSTKTAPNVSEFSVDVIWTYNEKNYHAMLKLGTKKEQDDIISTSDVHVATLNNDYVKNIKIVYYTRLNSREYSDIHIEPNGYMYCITDEPQLNDGYYTFMCFTTSKNAKVVYTRKSDGKKLESRFFDIVNGVHRYRKEEYSDGYNDYSYNEDNTGWLNITYFNMEAHGWVFDSPPIYYLHYNVISSLPASVECIILEGTSEDL